MSEQDAVAAAREAVALAEKATPGPWLNGSPDLRCTDPKHDKLKHPGAPHCTYTFQGWYGGGYFGCFVSSEATREEIVGSDESGAILTPHDARFIAHAGTHYATVARALLAAHERCERMEKALQDARQSTKRWGNRCIGYMHGMSRTEAITEHGADLDRIDSALRGEQEPRDE